MDASLSLIQFVRVIREYTRRHNQLIAGICKKPGYLSAHSMKKILLIGTGGTIASEITADGLAPELTSKQLLAAIPAISNICTAECIQLLNLDSTNMAPCHWRRMAKCIRDHYDRYDGFVLTHGTDTMLFFLSSCGVAEHSANSTIYYNNFSPIIQP